MSELRFSTSHEWARLDDDGTTVTCGLSEYAGQQLGEVVFVNMPRVGDDATAGEPIGEVESHKAVNDIYAPVSGEVVAVNDEIGDEPELVNNDAYGRGWLFQVRVSGAAALAGLLTGDAYKAHLSTLDD